MKSNAIDWALDGSRWKNLMLSDFPAKWIVAPFSQFGRIDSNGRYILASGSIMLQLLSMALYLLDTRSRFRWVNVANCGRRRLVGFGDGSGRSVNFDDLVMNVLLFLSDRSRKGVQHLQLWVTSFYHERFQDRGRRRLGRPWRSDGGSVWFVSASSTGANTMNTGQQRRHAQGSTHSHCHHQVQETGASQWVERNGPRSGIVF